MTLTEGEGVVVTSFVAEITSKDSPLTSIALSGSLKMAGKRTSSCPHPPSHLPNNVLHTQNNPADDPNHYHHGHIRRRSLLMGTTSRRKNRRKHRDTNDTVRRSGSLRHETYTRQYRADSHTVSFATWRSTIGRGCRHRDSRAGK